MAVSTRFAAPNLAALPPLPTAPGDEAILAERMTDVAARLNAAGIPYDVQAIKADTVAIIQRTGAYREGLVYQAYDDAIRAVLVASAWGPYLDHLGATQTPAVERRPLVADPRPYVYGTDSAADWEEDDDFRDRIQLAPETLSAAGPEGAYVGLATDVDGVRAAAAYGPMSFGGTPDAPFTPLGQVHVPVVAEADDGTAGADLVGAVQAALRPDDRRPLADFAIASAATILPYAIEVVLYVGPGADPRLVEIEAEKRLAVLARRQRRPAGLVKLLLIAGAASVTASDGTPVVLDLDVISPPADVNADTITPANPGPAYCAPSCTGITVRAEIRDG
ncbi:baseplate J/gp47 family protein [Methylobacterium aquaticum]|uniref:Baseplate J family protein n=1 Tax=Methylobacterium aquaticum TaxID=270351 RepID=A0A0C6FQ43_9HYPH|nr:baseplate J/gp47 family protein [Methylobacterium aquaticum]BAQ50418.1 baseplate J family protein [Methylobacterium aquaticum]